MQWQLNTYSKVPYSRKLSREKTFTSFAVLWLAALVNEMTIIPNNVSFALNNQISKHVTKCLSMTTFPSLDGAGLGQHSGGPAAVE